MANKSKSKKTKTKGNAASTIVHLFSFTFVFRCFPDFFKNKHKKQMKRNKMKMQ